MFTAIWAISDSLDLMPVVLLGLYNPMPAHGRPAINAATRVTEGAAADLSS